MKTLLLFTLYLISTVSFAKSVTCQDSNNIKTFNITLKENQNEVRSISDNILTKIVIKDLQSYSEVDDFAIITDLKTKRTMTYAIVCQDR